MSALEANAAAKLASGRKLDHDDYPEARFDSFRDLSARFRSGTISAGDYFRLFQEIFGIETSWVSRSRTGAGVVAMPGFTSMLQTALWAFGSLFHFRSATFVCRSFSIDHRDDCDCVFWLALRRHCSPSWWRCCRTLTSGTRCVRCTWALPARTLLRSGLHGPLLRVAVRAARVRLAVVVAVLPSFSWLASRLSHLLLHPQKEGVVGIKAA